MKFIIPANVLKDEEWNHIQVEYTRGNTHFGLKVNKCYDAKPTMLPILELDNDKEFSMWMNTRKVVEK